MPFKSDKQRRYLWSQKPEVARKFADHKQSGGGVYSSGFYDDSAKWWNNKLAGVPQHVGFVDDPDDITESAATNPDDPYGGRFFNPDRAQPKQGYTDLATYYTAKQRDMGRGEAELARMKIENERIKREAIKRGFVNPDGSTNFQEGGEVPMADNRKPKKVTHKDRYGNQITTEYESDAKPLDITTLFEKMLDMKIPEAFEIPETAPVGGGVTIVPPWGHPGEPKGSDTVPAWLTPGEFVVNAEAMSVPENAAAVEAINDEGRMMQQGGMMFQEGGNVPLPMSPVEALLRAREGYRDDVYIDSRGFPTVGHGRRLPDAMAAQEGQRPYTPGQLDEFFAEDRESAAQAAQRNAKHYGVDWGKLNRREKTALTSMAYQLGETGQKGFEKMWKALAAGDKEEAALQALDSDWAYQTPERAKDVYSALTPNLGFNTGGPVYAQWGMGIPNEWDLPDPFQDLSGGWTPPTYGMDDISPMEQAILDQEDSEYQQRLAQQIAMAENMVAGGDGDDLGREIPPTPVSAGSDMPAASSIPMPDEMTGEAPEEMGDFWSGVSDWVFDTSVADERNAAFNVKAAEANAEAAEETLAELEARVEAGQPVNSHTLDGAKAAVEHTGEKLDEARMEVGDIDYEGVVAGESLIMHNQSGTKEEKEEKQEDTLEQAANDPEMSEEDNPGKNSEKGQQHPSEVIVEGEKAAKEDPGMLEKATGFFKGAFSDLFDEKELARMAIMYVGSRALGYSHGGSLNWAAKQYVTRLDAKHASVAQNAKEFAKSGKYTPASVAAYQKSGDLSALQAVGTPTTITGNTMTRVVNGKKVIYQEVKQGDNTLYVGPDGVPRPAATIEGNSQPYEPSFEVGTPEYRARRSRATGDAAGRFEEVWKAEDTIPGGRDKPASHYTNIRPKQAADEFWHFMESHGLDPESDQALQIMTNAYHSAISDAKAGNTKPHSLKPYLQQEYVRAKTGAPEVFITNSKKVAEDGVRPTYVAADKMNSLMNNIEGIANQHGKSSNEVFQFILGKWQTLDAEQQKLYRGNKDESPFYVYAQQELAKVYG